MNKLNILLASVLCCGILCSCSGGNGEAGTTTADEPSDALVVTTTEDAGSMPPGALVTVPQTTLPGETYAPATESAPVVTEPEETDAPATAAPATTPAPTKAPETTPAPTTAKAITTKATTPAPTKAPETTPEPSSEDDPGDGEDEDLGWEEIPNIDEFLASLGIDPGEIDANTGD